MAVLNCVNSALHFFSHQTSSHLEFIIKAFKGLDGRSMSIISVGMQRIVFNYIQIKSNQIVKS